MEKGLETSDISKNGNDSTTKSMPVPQVVKAEHNTGYDNAENEFDTGFVAWLQVAGSFFLFFNSW